MLFYFLPAGLVLAIAVHALLQDGTTPNHHLESWLFIILAALLWPVTLPSMLRKKHMDLYNPLKSQAQAWSEAT